MDYEAFRYHIARYDFWRYGGLWISAVLLFIGLVDLISLATATSPSTFQLYLAFCMPLGIAGIVFSNAKIRAHAKAWTDSLKAE